MTEFRILPVTRYILTKYVKNKDAMPNGGSSVIGEYDNHNVAYEVGTALAKAEQQHLGDSPFSNDVIFPEHPNQEINSSLVDFAELHADYLESTDVVRKVVDDMSKIVNDPSSDPDTVRMAVTTLSDALSA